MNFIEQLLSEWYEYKGYFVRQNVKVGKRKNGGYEGELDIVALHPVTKHLIHIEPSADTDSWAKREFRYKKKFDLGKKYIPELFKGLNLPKQIEQEAVFLWGAKTRENLGGGKVMLLVDYFKIINSEFSKKRTEKEIVPENLSLIRTLHLFIDNIEKIKDDKPTPVSPPRRRKSGR